MKSTTIIATTLVLSGFRIVNPISTYLLNSKIKESNKVLALSDTLTPDKLNQLKQAGADYEVADFNTAAFYYFYKNKSEFDSLNKSFEINNRLFKSDLLTGTFDLSNQETKIEELKDLLINALKLNPDNHQARMRLEMLLKQEKQNQEQNKDKNEDNKENNENKDDNKNNKGQNDKKEDQQQKQEKEENNNEDGNNEQQNSNDEGGEQQTPESAPGNEAEQQKARMLLEALRNNEVQYLQQKRYKSKEPYNDKSPKW